MKRRAFLESSIAAGVVTAFGSSLARAAGGAERTHRISRIGLQLYTVREAMKQDFEGTLAKVAAVGYNEVEFAGYFDHAPKEVRAMLDRQGLAAPSGHAGYEAVEKKWPETLEAAHTVGSSYVVCAWINESQRREPDGWKRAAELFNRAGEASQKAGTQFAYHNYGYEFQPAETLSGKMPYDFLLAETDAKLVQMEMDLCWITAGGQDPLGYFERHPGRFPLVHVKDWVKDSGVSAEYQSAIGRPGVHGHMANAGEGAINWKRIFEQSEKAGIKHYFVENDEPKSPIEDIRTSFEYLKALRF